MSDVKPCPFCGGEYVRCRWNYMGDGFKYREIHCNDCSATLTKYSEYVEDDIELYTLWNTRAEPMKEIIHCEDCENSHFFYPWRYPGERSTVEVGTCALMAEGETIKRDGYCAFAERREK